jgi:PPK2 family polyphosphate:nucleotide phosphotransferase
MGKIKLKDLSAKAPESFDKEKTKLETASLLDELDELQNRMYAQSKYSLLVVLQGMDGSGKDGAIRKVFTSFNPQGLNVRSYKIPTSEELSHDFLWRIHHYTPARGSIEVFNRSHYEDIIVTRVHKLIDDDTAHKRMRAINDFEWLLQELNDTTILKFYLHVSHDEQLKRLNERIHDPEKQWKYNQEDFSESLLWDDYMKAYEDCFEYCNDVPWIIVPADQNWYKEYVIASEVLKAMKKLDMHYPGIKK